MSKWLPTGVPNDPAKYWHLIGHDVVVSTPGQIRHEGTLIAVGADRIILGGSGPAPLSDLGVCERIATTRIYTPDEYQKLVGEPLAPARLPNGQFTSGETP